MNRAVAAAAGLLALSVPVHAHAIRPDFDGEHGIEASIGVGYGGFTSNSQTLFWDPAQAATGTPAPILSPGAQLHATLGYRIHPLVSAGLLAQVQWLGTIALPGMAVSNATASAWAVGAYVRFYPAALLFHTLDVPRVRFDGAGDTRRFDPWLGVGVEFAQQLTYGTSDPNATTSDVRHSIGVPIMLGIAYRLLVPLAVEITAGIDPWIGGGVDKTYAMNDGSGNLTTTTSHIDSVTGSNVQWSVGLGLRYTLSL